MTQVGHQDHWIVWTIMLPEKNVLHNTSCITYKERIKWEKKCFDDSYSTFVSEKKCFDDSYSTFVSEVVSQWRFKQRKHGYGSAKMANGKTFIYIDLVGTRRHTNRITHGLSFKFPITDMRGPQCPTHGQQHVFFCCDNILGFAHVTYCAWVQRMEAVVCHRMICSGWAVLHWMPVHSRLVHCLLRDRFHTVEVLYHMGLWAFYVPE